MLLVIPPICDKPDKSVAFVDESFKMLNSLKVNTYGGNSNGAPCVFPFKYQNKIYYQCTNVDRDNIWCSTTYDFDIDGKFGYCSSIFFLSIIKRVYKNDFLNKIKNKSCKSL